MSNIGYRKIYEKAKVIKERAEKEHIIVGTKWAYYICKSILKPRTNIKSIGGFDYAPHEHGDTFNGTKIYRKDYLDCAKRITMYVEKFKKLPNYVKWGNKQIRTRDYTYNMAKILVYYYTHKDTYPTYNVIDSNVWKKPVTVRKYGHAEKHGCDNMGQNNGYYCGCHSVQEIVRNLTDIVVPQWQIAEWAGTTTDGTDHWGLSTAVAAFNKKYNKKLKVEWKNFSDLGWSGIKKIINSNNQDCIIHNLYRRDGDFGYGHYEVINKIYDNYCDVQNSLGDSCDYGCYCGYVEERYLSTFKYYIDGISQKSVMVVTNEG